MLPSLKPYNEKEYLKAVSIRLKNYKRIFSYYNKNNWSIKQKFKGYIKKQKATHEIVKRLFQDSRKYYSKSTIGEKMQNTRKEKRVPSPPKDKYQTDKKLTLIAYGDASFNSSIKGKLPAPTKRITEAITKMSEDSKGKTEIIFVDEYLTSQTCNNCKNIT